METKQKQEPSKIGNKNKRSACELKCSYHHNSVRYPKICICIWNVYCELRFQSKIRIPIKEDEKKFFLNKTEKKNGHEDPKRHIHLL